MNNCRISRLICCIADGKMSYSQTINQNKAPTPIWNKYQTSTSYQFSLTPSEFWVKYMSRKKKSKKARWGSCFLKMPLHTIQQLESHDGKENEGHIIGIGPWIWLFPCILLITFGENKTSPHKLTSSCLNVSSIQLPFPALISHYPLLTTNYYSKPTRERENA